MAQKYNDLYERVQRNLKGIKEVKNYKEMCDILEEDYQKTPSSKERQIERWATCFSFEKKGRSFKNIKILNFDQHFSALIKLFKSDSIIYSICGLLNQYYQAQEKTQVLYITKAELAYSLGFFNEAYYLARKDKTNYCYSVENKILDLRDNRYPFITEQKQYIRTWRQNNEEKKNQATPKTLDLMDDFTSHYSSNYEYKIKSALEKLKQMGYILYTESYIGAFIDFDKYIPWGNIYVENGKYYFDAPDGESVIIPYKDRELTVLEESKYLNISNQIFKEMGVSGLPEIYQTNRVKEYQKKMCSELVADLGCFYVYSVYRITFSKCIQDNENKYKDELSDSFSTVSLKKALRELNKTAIDTNTKNKIARIQKELVPERYKLGESNTIKGLEILSTQQQYEEFIFKMFTKDLLIIDENTYFPTTSDEVSKDIGEVKAKVFSNSKRRLTNTLTVNKDFLKTVSEQ